MMQICPVCGKNTCIHWPEHLVYRRGQTYYCSEQCMEVSLARDMKKVNCVIRRRINNKGKGENKVANHKLTLEQKKKAVEIFRSGGDYLRYLKECGAKNPSAAWAYIKQKMPEAVAEAAQKIPAQVETPEGEYTVKKQEPISIPEAMKKVYPASAAECMENMSTAVNTFFDQCREAGLKTITDEDAEAKIPEEEEPKNPLMAAEIEGMVVREVEGLFGKYRFTKGTTADYIDYENAFGLDVLSLTVEQCRKFREEQEKAARILGVEL